MRVVVCTAHDAGYQELADVTRPSMEQYCQKHGYHFHYENNIDEREKDACKARIFLALYASGQFDHRDLFMWIDSDAIIMNSAVKVEDVWGRRAGDGRTHFLWSYDFNGPNSGVWIARFTGQAANYIRVYAHTAIAMGWGDNESMNQKMLLPPFSKWVRCIEGKEMNCYPYELHGLQNWAHKNEVNNYEEGGWILHLAGIESSARLEYAKHYASLAR